MKKYPNKSLNRKKNKQMSSNDAEDKTNTGCGVVGMSEWSLLCSMKEKKRTVQRIKEWQRENK
jgi:hypothetical protein